MGGTGLLGILLAVLITTTSTQVLDCDFEPGFCQWSQVTTDKLDWSREKGPTSTPGTGPSTDHTSGVGFYAYLETSNGASGDTAELRSPTMSVNGHQSCLQFYYHMFGPNVADLYVYRVKNNGTGSRSSVWHKSGDQGDKWNLATVKLSTGSNFVIIIQAKRGADYKGDIAIDDIKYFTSGTCVAASTRCSFEDGALCNYTSSGSNAFRWVSSQGSTSTTRKPDHDHTTSTIQGHFAFLDTVNASSGQISTLTTTNLTLDVDKCLRFYFDLRGAYPGTLAVYRNRNGILSQALWSVSSAYSYGWTIGEVRLSAANGTNKAVFQGIVGPQNTGGSFSLDDISYSTAACRAPATCDFEESDTCTWSDDVGDQFDWIVWHGNTSSNNTGPTNDFTFANSSGHYLYAEASAPRKQGDRARLISTFIPPPQQAACFNFMYNMNGADVGTLNLYVQYSATITEMWTLSGDQGSGWLPGSFPLPPLAWTRYSQIVIEVITGKGYRGDIALDDLKYSTIACTVSPPKAGLGVPAPAPTGSPAATPVSTAVPVNTNTVTCTFEAGFCSWTQLTDDQKNWIRQRGNTSATNSGPIADHTTGTGYYLYMDMKIGIENNRARIISKTITPVAAQQCFTFWYHMRGSSTTTLNVYLKIGNQALGAARWTRRGDHGVKWNQASVSFTDSVPYAVVFEAVQGASNYGDVAVDDVKLVDGFCADVSPTAGIMSTPPAGTSIRLCDFEDGSTMCGYTQDKQDDFNWALTSRNSLNTQTGPSADHTYQTTQGHYILIDATNIRIGAKARLLSPVYNDSSYGALCMHFYTYMFGSGVGTLNVYIKPTSQVNVSQPVWHMSGNQGQRWIVGEVNILATTTRSPYQVVFEGIRGSDYRADIAVDDISFTEGPCPSKGSCTFENGFCSWTNIASNKVDWNSYRPIASDGTPVGDHTLGTSLGTFIFLSNKRNFMAGDTAELVSETFPPVSSTGRCLTFWYFMSGTVKSTLNIAVTTPGLSQTKFVWQLVNNNLPLSNTWQMARAPIPVNSNDYFVTIQGIYGSNVTNSTGGIGVDDVGFSESNCALYPPNAVPTVGLPTPPGPSTLAPQGTFDCTFENGMCAWQQDHTDKFDWTIKTGSTSTPDTGPNGDHTKADASGHYIYIETSMPRKQGDSARIISPELNAGTYCLQFFYNMYGSNVGSLNMYIKTGLTLPTASWHLAGTQGEVWHISRLNIVTGGAFNIVFEGVVGNGNAGDIALDDISMIPGSCASVTPTAAAGTFSVTCSFETADICGYRQDETDDFDWDRNRGQTDTANTGPTADHTMQTAAGYYMYVETSSPRTPGEKARLESMQVPASPTSPMCVNFWYSMYGISMGTLNIYIKSSSGLGSPVFTRESNQGSGWKEATISVPPTNSAFSVVFEAVVGSSFFSDIALDDITISNSNCTHPGNCNFDTGMCTWQNDLVDDDFDWLTASLGTASWSLGPIADHTMKNSSGKYVYINAISRVQGNKAWFVSQDLSPSMARCFHFWYYMSGSTVGNLNVWVHQSSDGSRVPIWSLVGNQGSQWLQGQAVIPPQTGSFQVIFEGVRGATWNGNIALDDISFDSLSGCSVVPTSARSQLAAITIAPSPSTTVPSIGTVHAGISDTATSISCSFSVDTCGWRQDTNDDYDWLRNKGSTASLQTGPDGDHTGGGYYMYIETSNSTYGKKATLISPAITNSPGQTKCFSFWYYMYGLDVNTLEVLMTTGDSQQTIWKQQGNKGTKWFVAHVPLTSVPPMTLYVRATTGLDYLGDIAVDDFNLTDGACIDTSQAQLADLSCDFESLCKYQSLPGDNLNWTVHRGPSGSEQNGPGYDHTSETAFAAEKPRTDSLWQDELPNHCQAGCS